jgi:DNA-binding transcriptional ArsR family regulator
VNSSSELAGLTCFAIVHRQVNRHAQLDRSFLALSHPVRRAIVERLVAGPATVGRASSGLGISKPAVTKHLKVLESAGVVSRTISGRTHVLQLEPKPLSEAAAWLELHRALWRSKFEVVERHLSETHEGQEVPE